MAMRHILIGTAGWSVPRDLPQFSGAGSGLERYATAFGAVEVNSSFYRRHRPDTWRRWHDAVPPGFRFAVKLPRTITHEKRLVGVEPLLDAFFSDVAPLGDKLGAILIQLPPSLAFAPEDAERFLAAVRARSAMPSFIEPRHTSWAHAPATDLLGAFAIARVLADPQQPDLRAAAEAEPLSYLRLHGSPQIYYSAYAEPEIARYAAMLRAGADPVWCIFDNTASGAALRDALRLRQRFDGTEQP